jgi:hypothetical protein
MGQRDQALQGWRRRFVTNLLKLIFFPAKPFVQKGFEDADHLIIFFTTTEARGVKLSTVLVLLYHFQFSHCWYRYRNVSVLWLPHFIRSVDKIPFRRSYFASSRKITSAFV